MINFGAAFQVACRCVMVAFLRQLVWMLSIHLFSWPVLCLIYVFLNLLFVSLLCRISVIPELNVCELVA